MLAVPTATIGAVTCVVRLFPTSEIFLPMSCIFLPVSSNCLAVAIASCLPTLPNCLSSLLALFSACSSSAIARFNWFILSVTSGVWSCAANCLRASFSLSSLSFVSETALLRSSCFCLNSSVFFGSTFNSLLTSFSCF